MGSLVIFAQLNLMILLYDGKNSIVPVLSRHRRRRVSHLSRSGLKHERIHQCIRCDDYEEKDRYCVGGSKDIQEPMKLIYCTGFKPLKEKNDLE